MIVFFQSTTRYDLRNKTTIGNNSLTSERVETYPIISVSCRYHIFNKLYLKRTNNETSLFDFLKNFY